MEEDTTIDAGYWKQNLYLLQERAPKPIVVNCLKRLDGKPPFYGGEYHGLIERQEADRMLKEAGEGSYLVRESRRYEGAYTLCMNYDDRVLNYKLYYDGMHFVGEKRFDTVHDLVADGLISMYIDKHAAEYIKKMAEEAIFEHSPYSIYTKSDGKVKRPDQSKAHNFSPYTWKMPHYCDLCRNYLWGLVQQGVRCEDCGYSAHKKCSERTLNDCRPEAKYIKRMFAVDITTLCLAHVTPIPPVLEKTIKEVERRGLNVEGIYRVSGSHEQMEKLRRQFDNAPNKVDLTQIDDIHTVCGLLKLYLRLLPQQLVPFHVYKDLLHGYSNARTSHDKTRSCREALNKLSDSNAFTLHALLTHLKKVSEHEEQNLMTVQNLSTIFSPTIFCSGLIPGLAQQQHQLLHFLIQHPRVVPIAKEHHVDYRAD